MSLTTSLKARLLRGLLGAPAPLLRAIAGAPVVRDGQSLAPETQAMLRLQRLVREPDVATLPIEQGRKVLDRQCALVGGRQPIAAVRDLTIDSRPARLYIPRAVLAADSAPTLLFFHGGGMVYGSLASHDAVCRHLAHHSGVQVLAYDYRLAPEHRFPVAVQDCVGAFRWLVAHAEQVNADPQRLAVGGDSAGGHLAAVTAVIAAQERLPLAWQLLIYPATEFVEPTASRRAFAEGFYLSQRFMDLAADSYFGDADRGDPLASVLRRTEIPANVAPGLVVTAGFDPLRDEGEAYADLLAAHGVAIEQVRYPDMIHGFFNTTGVGRRAPAYNREIAQRLRRALA